MQTALSTMATTIENPELPKVTNPPKHDESRRMKAVEWVGKKKTQIGDRPVPMVTDPGDAILRVTSTCICGSDLHLYLNAMPGMSSGDILGHEFMGIVEDIGPNVQGIKKGDRVIACFGIGCGQCFYCKKGFFTSCDATNTEGAATKALYGHQTGGLHGYSHVTGGWEGGQAEFARVPFADVNLLKVPEGMTDNQVVLLSDILPTAWHATELSHVGKGDRVAIWGSGPVGILAAQCAFERGAERVVLIDSEPYRLSFAKEKVPAVETINFKEVKTNVQDALHELLGQNAPDVGIEAVGFHYCKSWLHKVEMALMLETDPADMLNEIITSVRKNGRIAIVGAYSGYTNHFNIGALMEKGLSLGAGQTPVQYYWHDLLSKIQNGRLDPTVVITHELPLEEAPEAYQIFNEKKDGCIKVVLKPQMKRAVAGA